MKANLAKKPDGGDRPQAGAIFAGECDIALGNTYYVGLDAHQREGAAGEGWGNAINTVFPTFENGKTHVNISGAALAKNAPNRDNAVKLLQFLGKRPGAADVRGAELRVSGRSERRASAEVKAFGTLNADDLPLAEVASHRKEASEMVDRVGLDDGPSS